MVSDFFRDYPDPVPDYQYLDGDRGRGKLESALAQPRQSFGGQYLYHGLYEKAAALWCYLTLNHPFINGNKRMGLICCHIFLTLNGYALIAPQDEAVEMRCYRIRAIRVGFEAGNGIAGSQQPQPGACSASDDVDG